MVEANDGLDGEKEGVPQQTDSEEPEGLPGIIDLYRFVYAQPDAVFGLYMQLLDTLVEKGILNDDEYSEVIKKGIGRWKLRE